MTRENLKTLLEIYICSDPWHLSDELHKDFTRFLNAKALDFGFKDWVDAYHKL